jgi:hypothetical protein
MRGCKLAAAVNIELKNVKGEMSTIFICNDLAR